MSKPRGGGGGRGHTNYHQCPSHLLELNIISAQDLHPAASRMRSYAAAWVHSDQKVLTRLDPAGHTDPTWNDKFVFRVDDSFLQSKTAAVTIHILAARCRFSPRSDSLIGTVRIILSALRPSSTTRFVALQVRRPTSLRPQGILNVGIALLDAYIKSMPLYSDPAASAFALKDLVGGKKMVDHDDPRLSIGSGDGGEGRLERSRSLEVGNWVVDMEKEALESKLERWRSELSPVQDQEHRSDGGRSRRRRRPRPGMFLCFCSGG